MRILAFDPGETTGWCLADTATGALLTGDMPLWQQASLLIDLHAPDLVVVEAFRLYPFRAAGQSWSSFEPVKVIGVITYLCELRQVRMVEQMASEAKSMQFEKRGEKISKHAYDALRHALYRARKERQDSVWADRIHFGKR